MTITKTIFGSIGERQIYNFTLTSELLEVTVSEYGARIKSIYVKDRDGHLRNVVLSFDTLKEYVNDKCFMGAVCGRHANRIEGASVTINAVAYNLEKNEGQNNLHSGTAGYHARAFSGEIVGDSVVLSIISPHMDQGYPGVLHLDVIYSLTDQGGLLIEYRAQSDMDTVCNLTNHAYFNLEGNDNDILDHNIMVASNFYTPLKAGSLPDGEIRNVKGSPFDFTSAKRIGDPIQEKGSLVSGGYDHNFVLRGPSDEPAAVVKAPDSGICMQVYTTMPGIQFYSGNFLGGVQISGGKIAVRHQGFCLETQYFPNAFQYSHFPQPIIKAGELMTQATEYRFCNE